MPDKQPERQGLQQLSQRPLPPGACRSRKLAQKQRRALIAGTRMRDSVSREEVHPAALQCPPQGPSVLEGRRTQVACLPLFSLQPRQSWKLLAGTGPPAVDCPLRNQRASLRLSGPRPPPLPDFHIQRRRLGRQPSPSLSACPRPPLDMVPKCGTSEPGAQGRLNLHAILSPLHLLLLTHPSLCCPISGPSSV